MSDLESRLRSGLRADLTGIDHEQLLGDVHRGARRRRRRNGALVAVSVLAIAGIAGVAVQTSRDSEAPPAGPSPTPSPTGVPLPENAIRGDIDIDLVAGGTFKLTTNVGCSGCSSVWRRDSGGGWKRLHDFGGEAYGEEYDASYGPVGEMTMAANGKDGWAWGSRLYATHDGGSTWREIRTGPGGPTDQGHKVVLTKDHAWSLYRGFANAPVLYRTELGSDVWTKVDAPDLGGANEILSTGDAVILQTSDEGLAAPRIRASRDGTDWSRLDLPCTGENKVLPADTELFVLCKVADHDDGTVYRTRDLASWQVYGHSTGPVTAVFPLSDDRLLILGTDSDAKLLTPGGKTPVDTGLQRADSVYTSSSRGEESYLTTFDTRNVAGLIHSTDGGRTWSRAD